MKLSKVSFFLFVVVVILIARCGDLSSDVIDTSTRNTEVINQVAAWEKSSSSSTEVQTKPSKDEVLEHFQNTMDINNIKQANSTYSREEVKFIQKRLNMEGYDSGEVDGSIGSITIKAIASYQYDHGFAVTGILGESEAESLGVVKLMNVKVTLQSVKLAYNNSVGNDWGYSFYVNNEEIKVGRSKSITLTKGDMLEFEAHATEFDKIPDHGNEHQRYTYDELISSGTISAEMNVIVTENRGRYSGNTASWVFYYKIVVSQ